MNKETQLLVHRRALSIYAAICFLSFVFHGIWYFYMPDYDQLANLDEVQLDTIQLLNMGVTLFLLFTSLAAVWAARSPTLTVKDLRSLSWLFGGFWVARLVLELVMPLRIPLMFFDEPTILIRVLMASMALIVFIPFFLAEDAVN